jgi:hypothetical protein
VCIQQAAAYRTTQFSIKIKAEKSVYIKREYLIQSFPCLFFCFFFYRDLLAPFLTCIDWQIDMQNSAMSTLISKEEKNQQPKIQQFSQ